METQGTSPSVRANSAGVILDDYLYIVGGSDGVQRFDDMYRFHIPSCTWEPLAPMLDQLAGATLTHYRLANLYDYLVLCGGASAHSNSNSRISLYDVSRNEWHSYTPQPASPTELTYIGRNGHCAISMLPDQPQILVIGGSINKKYPSSTLLFDLSQVEPDVRVDRTITPEFSSFFNNVQFSDFRLHFKGQHLIHAHRIVLASRNERFRTLLSKRWSADEILDINMGEDEMEDVSFNTFYEMIRFIYVGEIEEIVDPIEMLKLADAYLIPSLKQHCEVLLKEEVTANTVLNILEYARHYHAEQLIIYCLNFQQYL